MFGYLKNFLVANTLSAFVHVGQINIDVPLRPMIVHGVVYRESKEIEQNILPELKNFSIFENMDAETQTNASANQTTRQQQTWVFKYFRCLYIPLTLTTWTLGHFFLSFFFAKISS